MMEGYQSTLYMYMYIMVKQENLDRCGKTWACGGEIWGHPTLNRKHCNVYEYSLCKLSLTHTYSAEHMLISFITAAVGGDCYERD